MDVVVGEGIPIGNGPHDKPLRQKALHFLLSAIPGLLQSIRQAHAQDVFHVIMSNEYAHLFKQGADGLYKPFLRAEGKFVENVNLAKIVPDYSKFATDLAAQVQMAAVMEKLDRIEQAVEQIGQRLQNKMRNDVTGSITAMNIAQNLSEPQERRNQILLSCNNAVIALKVLAEQLKSNIENMPSEKGVFFSYFFSDKLEDARKTFGAVTADMAVIATGCKAVLHAYEDLGEQEAAKVAFASFLNDIESSGLESAARKARLVPGTKDKPAPEALVTWFRSAAKNLNGYLLASEGSEKPFMIRMDIRHEDLET